MPIAPTYAVRETATNLKRNVLMTLAAIFTMTVSLGWVGGVMLIRQGVDKQIKIWRGGVELSVFMKPEASDSQIAAVKSELDSLPQVKHERFVNKDEAFKEMQDIFAGSKDVQDTITKDAAPTSFRVVPTKAELVKTIGARFDTYPGVYKVEYAKEAIDAILKSTRLRQRVYLIFAVVLLISAVILIFNTVQLAIFARRREVAVMKLVGATNWFIRIPFMLEGMVQGVVGGLVASAMIYWLRNFVIKVGAETSLNPLRALHATPGEAFNTGIALLLIGAVVGAAGSAVAVRRFLDV
jgi:cell division transport system permease protein